MKHFARRIFVVEDEPLLARSLQLDLEGAGYAVVTFLNAETASSAVRDGPPDLIISDVVLPGMSGIDLKMWVAESFPSVKMILMSGDGYALVLTEEARQRGYFVATRAKSLPPQELLGVIAQLLGAASFA